jgi:ubiquinol-cytochrome c reductase cytochrome c subunit
MRLALVLAVALVLAAPAAGGGREVFGRYCASCHGPDARGQEHGPSLRGVGALAAHFYLTTGYMPLPRNGLQPRRTRQVLSQRQVDQLIGYVASFGGPPVPDPHPEDGDVAEGLKLFRSNCSGCHQIVAQGGYITHAVPPSLADATPTQIAEAVRLGPYVMPEFSKQAISDDQLNSIIRYVEYAKHPDNRGGWALGNVGPIPEGLVAWFLAGTVLIGTCLLIGRRLRA